MAAEDDFISILKNVSLTGREQECLELLADGLNYDGMAKRLGISDSTVAMHVTNARRKLHAASREQAVATAFRLGLLK